MRSKNVSTFQYARCVNFFCENATRHRNKGFFEKCGGLKRFASLHQSYRIQTSRNKTKIIFKGIIWDIMKITHKPHNSFVRQLADGSFNIASQLTMPSCGITQEENSDVAKFTSLNHKFSELLKSILFEVLWIVFFKHQKYD